MKTLEIPRVRTRFRHPHNNPKFVSGVSKTQTHQRDDADINKLVARFTRAGVNPAGKQPGNFLDLATPGLGSLMEAEAVLSSAHSRFMALPSDLRLAFGNNAIVMADWLSKPENHAKAVEIGLLPASVLPKAPEAPKPRENAPEVAETPPQGG